MKVGFVTDTHLGIREDSNVLELLEDLSNAFLEENVDRVIHLGDVAHEAPRSEYSNRVGKIREIFSDFEFHMTLGNHDVQAMSQSEFEAEFDTTPNEVIWKDDETSLLLINSAGMGSLPGVDESYPVGYFSDKALDMVETELDDNQDVVICTHYPIQYILEYQSQPFFNIRPEYTFPCNKLEFEKLVSEYDSPSITSFCGHLHPDETVTYNSNPFDIDISVVQSVQLFDSIDGNITWWDNTYLSIDNLVFDF